MIDKLDRNKPENEGRCKYSLILNQKLRALPPEARRVAEDALKVLEEQGVLDHAASGDGEAFVIRLKDQFASKAPPTRRQIETMKFILELDIPDDAIERECQKEGITVQEFSDTIIKGFTENIEHEGMPPGTKVRVGVSKTDRT